MLAFFKNVLSDSAKKFSGKKDFLEAVCAASSLVAASDGDIDDSEVVAAVTAVKTNAVLKASFPEREIESTMDTMIARSKGRVGKAGLMKEIEDIKADHDMSETVLLVALDVADSGGISEAETAVLKKIAATLGLDLNKYL